MPVYNTERFLREAVDSILGQTFADFELIVVNDGSTDSSLAILREYARRDSRVRLLSRPNTGIVGARNDALAVARGEFIAVMDSDDISMPQRLERQHQWFMDHPRGVAVGSWVLCVDEDGDPLTIWRSPTEHDTIDAAHLRGASGTLFHGSSMLRRAVVAALGGYREGFRVAEDYDLFLRLAEVGELGNIPEVLLKYRNHRASTMHTSSEKGAHRLVQRAVADARRRRGLPVEEESAEGSARMLAQAVDVKWAWWAWMDGFTGTARKYARRALWGAPWSLEAWKLFLVTHLKRPPKVSG